MVPQTMDIEVEDARAQTQKFLHNGHIVLLTIICSTVTNAITLGVQDAWVRSSPTQLAFVSYNLSVNATPLIGMMLFSFISLVVGRKLVLISLFTLSILSGILHSLPWQESIRYSFPFHGLFRGGALIMNMLAITEYATPKHRFTYLIVESLTLDTIFSLLRILFMTKPSSYPYVLGFQIVLGLLCVASACRWPESPYWLASKGKLEQSRKAFLWLRGQEGWQELNSLLKGRRSRGPIKLYWKSFFVALATISVSLFTEIGTYPWYTYVSEFDAKNEDWKTRELLELIIRACGSVVIASSVSVLSYFVKRKVLFLLVCGMSILLSYGIAIWMNVDPTFGEYSNRFFYFVYLISDLISRCGPSILATVLCVEIVPVKYNTHLACVGLLPFYVVFSICINLFQDTFTQFATRYASLPINTTLSLIGVVVYYFLAPETKGKTLLEIQKAYTPELIDANPKEEDEATKRL